MADLLISAIAVGKAPAVAEYELWKNVVERSHGGSYGWTEVFAAARSTGPASADDALRVLDRIARSDMSWDAGLQALQAAEVLKPIDADEARKPWRSQYFAQVALARLLASHCQARYGNTQVGDAYERDAPTETCEGVPNGFPVTSIAGRRLAIDGMGAALAQRSSCAERGNVDIADGEGHVRHVECQALSPLAPFYRFIR